MMRLTPQEDEVRRLLIDRKLSFDQHHVFDLARLGRLSVDFLVFHGPGIVLECTACSTKRGRALSEVRRRAAFMDYRFRLLKTALPRLLCGALVEAASEDQSRLANELKQIFRNADFSSRTVQELDDALYGVLGSADA
jgi:hypothetical protein